MITIYKEEPILKIKITWSEMGWSSQIDSVEIVSSPNLANQIPSPFDKIPNGIPSLCELFKIFDVNEINYQVSNAHCPSIMEAV